MKTWSVASYMIISRDHNLLGISHVAPVQWCCMGQHLVIHKQPWTCHAIHTLWTRTPFVCHTLSETYAAFQLNISQSLSNLMLTHCLLLSISPLQNLIQTMPSCGTHCAHCFKSSWTILLYTCIWDNFDETCRNPICIGVAVFTYILLLFEGT